MQTFEQYLLSKTEEELWWALGHREDVKQIYELLEKQSWPNILPWETFKAKRCTKALAKFFGYEKAPDAGSAKERLQEYRDNKATEAVGAAPAALGKYRASYIKIGTSIGKAEIVQLMERGWNTQNYRPK